MSDNQQHRMELLIEAAENVIDNFAPPKGEAYLWDELRAALMLLSRDTNPRITPLVNNPPKDFAEIFTNAAKER
jgi:hypothetical protein